MICAGAPLALCDQNVCASGEAGFCDPGTVRVAAGAPSVISTTVLYGAPFK